MATLQAQLITAQSKIAEANRRIENLTNAIAETSSAEVRNQLDSLLHKTLDHRAALQQQCAALKRTIIEETSATQEATDLQGNVIKLLSQEQSVDVRLRLRAELRRLVSCIKVGVGPNVFWFAMEKRMSGKINRLSPPIKIPRANRQNGTMS